MYTKINEIINQFSFENIQSERLASLQPLADYIKSKKALGESIRLNFICTHNSRRSHLSQIWAQTLAYHFGVKNVNCYSGGTEATAMFPKIAETLANQGFEIIKLSEGTNPVYGIKYAAIEPAVVCFSKVYNSEFNPKSKFAAIMTCDSADENCPIVFGAAARFPVKYNDPKAYDGTDLQNQKYTERSLEIAQELWWVFSQV